MYVCIFIVPVGSSNPNGLQLSSSMNLLYYGDSYSLHYYDLNVNNITTVAGTAGVTGYMDGYASAATFPLNGFVGMVFSSDDLFLIHTSSSKIRYIYVYQSPLITAILPTVLIPFTATTLTLTGQYFGPGINYINNITFGVTGSEYNCGNITYQSSTSLMCTLPNYVVLPQTVQFILTVLNQASSPFTVMLNSK